MQSEVIQLPELLEKHPIRHPDDDESISVITTASGLR